MWYNRAKLIESQMTDHWWRNNYLSHGHRWNQRDDNPDNEKTRDESPVNPNDAIWLFRNGSLEVITAQEWFDKGGRGNTFTHDDVFRIETGGNWTQKTVTGNFIKGRYDAQQKLVSAIVPIQFEKMYEIALRRLYQRFPGAKIQEFRSK